MPTQKHIEFQLSAHSQPFNRSGRPPPTVQRDKEKEQGLTHDEVALCPSAPRHPGRVQAPHKEFTVPRIFFQASLCFSTGRVAFAEPRRSQSHTSQRFVRHLRAFQTGHESHTETNPTRSSRSHDHAPRRQTSAALAGTTVQQKNATSVLFNTGTINIHPKMTLTLRSAKFLKPAEPGSSHSPNLFGNDTIQADARSKRTHQLVGNSSIFQPTLNLALTKRANHRVQDDLVKLKNFPASSSSHGLRTFSPRRIPPLSGHLRIGRETRQSGIFIECRVRRDSPRHREQIRLLR